MASRAEIALLLLQNGKWEGLLGWEVVFFVLGVLVLGQEIEVVEGEVVVPPFDFKAAFEVFFGGRIIATVDLVPSHVVQDFVLVGV